MFLLILLIQYTMSDSINCYNFTSKAVPYLWNGSLVPTQQGDYEIYYEVVDTPSTQWSTDIKGCALPVEWQSCASPA